MPHEQAAGIWQGAVCELPMPAFATGIMRGRFAADGALYTCGMFAWAGNATAPGGFYRIRRDSQPAHVPLAIHPQQGALQVTFSDPLDPASVTPAAFAFTVWHLKRSADYGSQHYDEHPLAVTAAGLGPDTRTLTLDIPALTPTQCYELLLKLRGADGTIIEWTRGDVVAIPAWRPYRHMVNDDAYLVRASDEPLMNALGLLRTERLAAQPELEVDAT